VKDFRVLLDYKLCLHYNSDYQYIFSQGLNIFDLFHWITSFSIMGSLLLLCITCVWSKCEKTFVVWNSVILIDLSKYESLHFRWCYLNALFLIHVFKSKISCSCLLNTGSYRFLQDSIACTISIRSFPQLYFLLLLI